MNDANLLDHRCSECGRPVGLVADKDSAPVYFKCIYTGRVAELQIAVHR